MKRFLNRNKKGFTIVELVIVIGVIGILSAILIPTFVNLNSRATEAARKSDLAAVYSSYVADVADGYYGEEEIAGKKVEKMYEQNDICLKEVDGPNDQFYVYGEGGWKVNLQTKAALEEARTTDDYEIKQLHTATAGEYLVYSGYEVWAFVE